MVIISLRKQKETLILLNFSLPPLVKDDEVRGGVFFLFFFQFTGRKTASRSHKLHLENNDSPQSQTGIMSSSFFLYLQHKDQKETSWGECE